VTEPLVAIATPVYNGEKYLAETMQCVQSQTYPNLVHCLLDNGSTDTTPEIIERFRNCRVPLIVGRNTKTVPHDESWNGVIDLIPQGTSYFRVLPADDLIRPDAIEKMVRLGQKYRHVDLISCLEVKGSELIGQGLPPDRSTFSGKSVARGLLLSKTSFSVLHSLYRYPKDGIQGSFFEKQVFGAKLLAFDADAALRIMTMSQHIAQVHEPLATTRQHPASITSTQAGPNALDLWSHFQLMYRWGPFVFAPSEYHKYRKRQLRFYYRNLLLWKALRKNDLFSMHRGWLESASASPTVFHYAFAVAEWPFIRLMRKFSRPGAYQFE
jgi:glycosyltransferase involved in cell wall biosynthesis